MIKDIFLNSKVPFKRRIKNSILYLNKRRGVQNSWNKRHDNVLSVNPEYKNSLRNNIEYDHNKLWSKFRKNVDNTTLRISGNISNKPDPKIVPEDIYLVDLEPSLKSDKSSDFIGNKSFYNKWFLKGIFPKDLFHRVDGQFLKANLNPSNYDEFLKFANSTDFPIILKPNRDTYGGADINFVTDTKQLIELAESRQDFVVQEIVKQNEYFDKFNDYGLNTVKVFLYRSVVNDELHVLSMSLRMGKDNSLDNEAAGGINCFIDKNGYLNEFAIDKYGNKYYEHPNTKKKFNGKIPDFKELTELSLQIGSKVFLTRIIGLDACYDQLGNWRIIEVNTFSQSIRFSQYAGQPFFGEFTDEVIDYCVKNHWALK